MYLSWEHFKTRESIILFNLQLNAFYSYCFLKRLSAILIADFTLELREHNSAKIEETNITLPTLHFRSIVQHVHQSFLVEVGTPEDTEFDTGTGDGNDILGESEHTDTESVQGSP